MNKPALLFVALGALLLAGLFVWLRPASLPTSTASPTTHPATATADTGNMPTAITDEPAVHHIDWIVRDGHRLAGPERITIHLGDAIQITVDSDHDDELHVHGYDLHLAIHANQPASLRFTADRAGRFDCELHHADLALGALEVQPR